MHFSPDSLLHLLTLTSIFLTSVLSAPTPTTKRATLVKRYDLEDATDVAKILEWMGDEIDNTNFVFYSGNSVGAPMAKKFCDENEEEGYKYFYYIFDDAFSQAFGGADPSSQTDIAKACSKAMAKYADGVTRVFNDDGASDTSFWKTIEKPGLKDNDAVTKIWSMNDDTTDPDEHDAGDLKNPDDGGDDGDEGTCKPSGPYSTKSACTKACKGGGKCKSGSAGFPIPQTYYSCSCP